MGNNSSIGEAILINLHVHQLNMVIHIYFQFHEAWFSQTLVMAILQILNQLKCKYSCSNNAILIKLGVRHHIIIKKHLT